MYRIYKLNNDRLQFIQSKTNQVFVQCVQDIEDQSIKSHHHLHKIIINTLLHQNIPKFKRIKHKY